VLARREYLIKRPKLRRRILYGIVRYPERIAPELVYEVASGAGKPGFFDALAAIASYDFSDRLPAISAPTLLVWGRNDWIVPVAGAYEYEQLIPGAKRVIFEETGHLPMLERPARFNQLVEEFLTA
jgi:pimeloyl-ACP methyl ester carboxylesterase